MVFELIRQMWLNVLVTRERVRVFLVFYKYSDVGGCLSVTLEQTSEYHLRKPMGAVSVFTTGNYRCQLHCFFYKKLPQL